MIFTEAFLARETSLRDIPFLYAEELFVGEICRRANWTVRYEPALKVWHLEHATTGALPQRRRFALQRAAMKAYWKFVA